MSIIFILTHQSSFHLSAKLHSKYPGQSLASRKNVGGQQKHQHLRSWASVRVGW